MKINQEGMGAILYEERANMLDHAAGRAVMELSLADLTITQQAIIDKLEQRNRKFVRGGQKSCEADTKKTGSAAGLFDKVF